MDIQNDCSNLLFDKLNNHIKLEVIDPEYGNQKSDNDSEENLTTTKNEKESPKNLTQDDIYSVISNFSIVKSNSPFKNSESLSSLNSLTNDSNLEKTEIIDLPLEDKQLCTSNIASALFDPVVIKRENEIPDSYADESNVNKDYSNFENNITHVKTAILEKSESIGDVSASMKSKFNSEVDISSFFDLLPLTLEDSKLKLNCFVRLVDCANLLRLCAANSSSQVEDQKVDGSSTPPESSHLFNKSNVSKSLIRNRSFADDKGKEFKKFKSESRSDKFKELSAAQTNDCHSSTDRNLFSVDFLSDEIAKKKSMNYKNSQIDCSLLKFHPPFLRNMNLQPIVLLERVDTSQLLNNGYIKNDVSYLDLNDIDNLENKNQRFKSNSSSHFSTHSTKHEKLNHKKLDQEKDKLKRSSLSIKPDSKPSKASSDLDRYLQHKRLKKLEKKKHREHHEHQDGARQLEEAIRLKPDPKTNAALPATSLPSKRIPKIVQLTDEDRARSVLAKIETPARISSESSGWRSSRPPRYPNPQGVFDQNYSWRRVRPSATINPTPQYPNPDSSSQIRTRLPYNASPYNRDIRLPYSNSNSGPYNQTYLRNGYCDPTGPPLVNPVGRAACSSTVEVPSILSGGDDGGSLHFQNTKKSTPLLNPRIGDNSLLGNIYDSNSIASFDCNSLIDPQNRRLPSEVLNENKKYFNYQQKSAVVKPLLPNPTSPPLPHTTNQSSNIFSRHPLIKDMSISQIIAALSEEDMIDRIIGSMSPNESVQFLQAVIVEAAKVGIMNVDECSILKLVGSEVLAMDDRPPLLPTPFDESFSKPDVADTTNYRLPPINILESQLDCRQSVNNARDDDLNLWSNSGSGKADQTSGSIQMVENNKDDRFVSKVSRMSLQEQYLTKVEEESILIDVIISIQKELVGGISIEDHLAEDSGINVPEILSVKDSTPDLTAVCLKNKSEESKDSLSPSSSITKDCKSTPNSGKTDSQPKTSTEPNKDTLIITYARNALKQHYHMGRITSMEYKEIMKKAIIKINDSKAADINDKKVARFIDAYVEKTIHSRSRQAPATPLASSST